MFLALDKKFLRNGFALAMICICLWQVRPVSAQSPGQNTMVINFPVQGWYLLSLPLTVADSSVNAIFPTALGVFAWDNATNRYVQPTTLQTGRGYWVLMAAPTAVAISGKRFSQYRRHYLPGWHLIGSLIDSISFANPEDTPDNSVLLPTFAWHAGEQRYYSTTAIEQSYGHWMGVFQECDVTVKLASTMMAEKAGNKFPQQTFHRRFGAMPPPGSRIEFPDPLKSITSRWPERRLPGERTKENLPTLPSIIVNRIPSAPNTASTPEQNRAEKIALQINTVPLHCDVIVDDKYVGQSPLRVYVDRRSSHIVQIFRNGYEEKTKVLDWKLFGTDAIYLLIEKLEPKR